MSNQPNRRAVVVAGDSHCSAYNGLTCIDQQTRLELVAVDANIRGYATAAAITTEDRRSFHPDLVREIAKARAAARAISEQPPLFVIALGGPDCVLETADAMWGEYDFIHPDVPSVVNRAQRCIQYEIVKGWLADRLAPYEQAFDLFKAEGIEIAAILPPPPAHRSNRKFISVLIDSKQTQLFVAPFPVRGKMAWMTRCHLADLAKRRGIPFVDTWPILANGLFLRPEYEFDGLHVSRGAAENLMRLLYAALAGTALKAA